MTNWLPPSPVTTRWWTEAHAGPSAIGVDATRWTWPAMHQTETVSAPATVTVYVSPENPAVTDAAAGSAGTSTSSPAASATNPRTERTFTRAGIRILLGGPRGARARGPIVRLAARRRAGGDSRHTGPMDTLIWSDTDAEIHKVVVGPMDNNVYVLRCRDTGDAVLLDAANEHDRLLDLCKALNVK